MCCNDNTIVLSYFVPGEGRWESNGFYVVAVVACCYIHVVNYWLGNGLASWQSEDEIVSKCVNSNKFC